jgi:hypothetical protein
MIIQVRVDIEDFTRSQGTTSESQFCQSRIPKYITNLKCSLNSIKIRCTNVVPNASIWQYTVVSTLCRQSSGTEIEFGQSASGCQWLARRRGSEKHPSEGSRRGTRARHSLRKPVAPRFKNGALLKRQNLKMISRTMSRSICDNDRTISKKTVWSQMLLPTRTQCKAVSFR